MLGFSVAGIAVGGFDNGVEVPLRLALGVAFGRSFGSVATGDGAAGRARVGSLSESEESYVGNALLGGARLCGLVLRLRLL